MVYSGDVLSGSANGRPIPVAATSTPGTLIHTAGGSGYDEVYFKASNVTASVATLTVEWGGTSNPGDHFIHEYSIPANSPPIPIATGGRVAGGVAIRAFCSVASAINIVDGFVNKAR